MLEGYDKYLVLCKKLQDNQSMSLLID